MRLSMRRLSSSSLMLKMERGDHVVGTPQHYSRFCNFVTFHIVGFQSNIQPTVKFISYVVTAFQSWSWSWNSATLYIRPFSVGFRSHQEVIAPGECN
ncbi:hypothetical protein T4D_6946 [Trichinella pseudospiralis]|uniref:Uncharacterized protein n=1 Tax=Trichinella pseudospiralis TaxID=6337 RepID=A0A0V1DQ95_TRIPS|nr:hypothetical protein T4D_6946 [Trichinella pseudospiralis]